MLPMKEISLAPGVILRTVQTPKFKTSILGVTFLEPLSEKTAALNALLPWVLQRGTQTHPDMESLSAATDDLYGGTISPVLRKKGEVQCVGFLASFLDDAFVPTGTYILEPAAQLLGEMVLSPAGDGVSFLPDYVSSEQENLIDRIRSQVNDKLQYSLSRLQEQMCQDEAYGLGKMGTEEQAKSITGQRLFARYQELLETAPIYLYYCGSADPNRVEAAFRAAFSGLPKTERRPIPQTAVRNTPEGPVRRFQDQMEVNQGKLILGFRTGGSFLSQQKVAQAMLFNAVYGGTTNAKLFLNVREALSLCYFANSALVQNKGVLHVYSGVEFANFQRAEDEILAQLKACQNGQIDQGELEAARRSMISNLRTTLDSQGRLEEYWLNRFVTGTSFAPEELEAALAQVTLDQVIQTAQGVQLDSVYTLRNKEG